MNLGPLVALLETNPNAFCLSNINCLKIGATLLPPDPETLAAISDATARAEARRQYGTWVKHIGVDVEPGATNGDETP